MKKLIALSYAALCIVLMVIAYQNYSFDILESIESGKQTISIEKPKEITNEQFLFNIANVVEKMNADIAYKYVDIEGTNARYMYYITNNCDDFIDTESAKALPNIEFYALDQADKYDLSKGNYYVDNKLCDMVAGKISELGYDVMLVQNTGISGKISIGIFTTIPIILLLMSMTFYMLSVGKRTVLRKMDGYTNVAILGEEFIKMLPIYLVIGTFIEAIGLFGVKVTYNNSLVEFLKYQSEYILLMVIVVVIGEVISLICIYSQRKIAYIKGMVPKRGIYIISMFTTIVFMVFIAFFMTIGLRDIKACYDIYKTADIMSSKTKGYVSVPIYQNSASSEGLEKNYLDFYKKTVDKYDGVLIYSKNYQEDIITGKSRNEEYDQDNIIVNENYLKINPVYDNKEKPISLIKTDRGDVINVILPYDKKDEMDKYEQLVSGAYHTKVNFEFYDNTITNVYSYNAEVGNGTYGKLDSPVIIVLNKENLTGDFVLSYCSQDSYILKPKTDSPYEELKPILQETGILKVTPQTPYIASNYGIVLAAEIDNLKLYGTQSVFLAIGLILLVLYTAILYCNNYKKKIICKIIEGYSIHQCVAGHMIFKVIIYIVSLVAIYITGNLSGVGMNYYIIFMTFILDVIITMILCFGINKKNIYDVVKGD